MYMRRGDSQPPQRFDYITRHFMKYIVFFLFLVTENIHSGAEWAAIYRPMYITGPNQFSAEWAAIYRPMYITDPNQPIIHHM